MIVSNNYRSIDRFSVAIGDVRQNIKACPANVFQSICTSPPYFEMRDYEVEGQMGLEASPAAYIDAQVELYREVRRILRPDGTFWLNIGDKYSASGSGNSDQSKEVGRCGDLVLRRKSKNHARIKNLLGLPWRLALAMQEDGWNLRSEIIWDKMNPMVESPKDRCPREHEHVFMFTKSRHYYFDRFGDPEDTKYGDPGDVRPRRTVWEIGTQKAYARHFAMFPVKLPERCFRMGASLLGCCPKCRTPYHRFIVKERIATRPGKTSMAYKPANWHADGVKADPLVATLDRHIVRGKRDPERHITKYKFAGWNPGCGCFIGTGEMVTPVPCLVGDVFHGAGRSLVAADRLSMDYVGFELNPKCVEDTLIELEADRKKRNKEAKRKRRVAKPFKQMPLIEEVDKC